MTAVLWWTVQDSNSTATPQAGQQTPQCNDDDRRLRRKQGAEAGAAF